MESVSLIRAAEKKAARKRAGKIVIYTLLGIWALIVLSPSIG